MEAFGKLVAVILVGAAGVFSTAYAFVILWGWFVVPQFHMQPLNLATAYAILMLVSLTRAARWKSSEENEQSFSSKIGEAVGSTIVSPWVAVGIGWLIK